MFDDRDCLTVNAEIAHIRSGAGKGPRHDPNYPKDKLNEEENLLLLCGIHHKPVDDHTSTYPVEELLEWKRVQVAGPRRDLTAGQVSQLVTHYNLDALGHEGFERLCQALAVKVLGPDTEVFGSYHPRSRWDAAHRGRLSSYPSPSEPWDGYVVLEAAFKASSIPAAGWLRRRVKQDLEHMRDVRANGDRPDYLIIACNVSLPPSPQGELDVTYSYVDGVALELGLKGWSLWDEPMIHRLLDTYPDVRLAFLGAMSSQTSVEQLMAQLGAARRRS